MYMGSPDHCIGLWTVAGGRRRCSRHTGCLGTMLHAHLYSKQLPHALSRCTSTSRTTERVPAGSRLRASSRLSRCAAGGGRPLSIAVHTTRWKRLPCRNVCRHSRPLLIPQHPRAMLILCSATGATCLFSSCRLPQPLGLLRSELLQLVNIKPTALVDIHLVGSLLQN